MPETNVLRTATVSGSSYVLDVSILQLLPQLDIRDFIVTHNGIDRSVSYTKTSQTQLTYAGSAVVLGTVVQVQRVTPLTFGEATFISTTTATQLTNAMTKLKRRVDELEALVSLQSSLITSGGVSPGVLPIVDTPYAASWDNDVTTAPSRNSVYDVINRIDTGSNTWTGSYNFSTSPSVLVPTQPASDNSTRASSTAQTQSAIDVRLRLYANRLTSVNLTTSAFQDLQLNNTIVNRDSYNTSNYTWTCPSTGIYIVSLFALPIATGGTTPTRTNSIAAVSLNGTSDIFIGGGEFDTGSTIATGTILMSLTAGNTLKPRLLVSATGGSGFTFTVGANNTYLPQFAIYKLT